MLRSSSLVLMLAVARCSAPTGDDDDSSEPTPLADVDQDGYGADVDCDDANPAIHPGAVEECNGLDDDCNGVLDDGPGFPQYAFYPDADGDGYAGIDTCTAELSVMACAAPPGYAGLCEDCDDADKAIYPYAIEVCDNGKDDNCNGLRNEGCK